MFSLAYLFHSLHLFSTTHLAEISKGLETKAIHIEFTYKQVNSFRSNDVLGQMVKCVFYKLHLLNHIERLKW